jgi:hypothetical protein
VGAVLGTVLMTGTMMSTLDLSVVRAVLADAAKAVQSLVAPGSATLPWATNPARRRLNRELLNLADQLQLASARVRNTYWFGKDCCPMTSDTPPDTPTPKSPAKPTKPWDARHLTDDQVAALTPAWLTWADLTERQVQAPMARPLGPDTRAPSEARPDRIPAPADLEQIKSLFRWVDSMHEFVRRPQGMAWVEIQLMLASCGQMMDWSASDPPISRHYRYRIDAPLDPDEQAPDHVPEDWEEDS